jgi:pimeloyl-ACP methyl ester carboxylesterase
MAAEAPIADLALPNGRRVRLPGRGETFVREVAGPPGAPTLVLLHGWVASGGLNWFQAFEPLSRHFRVVAPDLRGHARGLRSWRQFRLADCADDVAVLMDELDCRGAIAVGYSMGGLIAQLLWKRHRRSVSGLVLCATAHSIVPVPHEQFFFSNSMSAIAGTARLGQLASYVPRSLVRSMFPPTRGTRPQTMTRWAAAEMARHDWRMVLEAGASIGRFDAREWIGSVDVPSAVVLTAQDRAIGVEPQLELAQAIPGASIHRVDDGHVACAREGFGPPLVRACLDVARRAQRPERLATAV